MNRSTRIALFFIAAICIIQISCKTDSKIKEKKAIVLGVRKNKSPFSYSIRNEESSSSSSSSSHESLEFTGYSVDICFLVVQHIKESLGLDHLDVKFKIVTNENRFDLLLNDAYDLECGTTTNTVLRQLNPISFAFTNYVDRNKLLVLADSDIKSLAQLDCKKVAVIANSTQYDELIKYQAENNVNFHLRLITDNSVGLDLVKSGKVTAWYGQEVLLESILADSKHPTQYAFVEDSVVYEPMALMMRKENQIFAGLVNQAMLSLFEDGTIDIIYNQWFRTKIPPNNINLNIPLNDETKYDFENPNSLPKELYSLY